MFRRGWGFWLIFLCSSLSCGSDLSKADKGLVQEQHRGQLCYLGPQNASDYCISTIPRADIDDSDYRYRDPFTDPSFPSGLDARHYLPPEQFVILDEIPGTDFIAGHFQVGELMQAYKGPYGFFAPLVVKALESIRRSLDRPLEVTSGFRSPGYNAEVDGSASWSRHSYGDAVDFHVRGVSLANLERQCKNKGATFTLIYQTHIHCDWRGNGQGKDAHLLRQRLSQSMHIESQLEGHNLKARVYLSISEDDAPLIYRWVLTTPNRVRLKSSAEEAEFLLSEGGEYRLEVTVGGSLKARELFTWTP